MASSSPPTGRRGRHRPAVPTPSTIDTQATPNDRRQNSNDDGHHEDEMDETSTEIAPRPAPAPTPVSTAVPNSAATSSACVQSPGLRPRIQHDARHGNGTAAGPANAISTHAAVAGTAPAAITASALSIEHRIDSLERRLTEDGIGAILAPEPRSLPPSLLRGGGGGALEPPSAAAAGPTASQPDRLPTFLSTLRSLSAAANRTNPNSSPSQRVRKEIAISSLLGMFEVMSDEVSRLNTEVEGQAERDDGLKEWKDKEGRWKVLVEELVGEVERLRKMSAADEREVEKAAAAAKALEREIQMERAKALERATELRDSSTCTSEAHGGEGGDVDREAGVVADEVVRKVREDNEKLRALVEQVELTEQQQQQQQPNNVSLETNSQSTPTPHPPAPQQQHPSSSHDAVHHELRDRSAYLEEENRALLHRRRLEFDGLNTSAATCSVGTPTYRRGMNFVRPLSVRAASTEEGDLYGALRTKDLELTRLHESMHHLQSENQDLRRALHDRTEQLGQAEGEVRTLTKHGHAMAVDNSRLATELDVVLRRAEEESRRSEEAERTVRQVEAERTELLRNYSALAEERTGFERGTEELVRERSRLFHELALCQEEVRRLQEQLHDRGGEVNRLSDEVVSSGRRLDEATRDGLAVRRTIEATEAENWRLKEDLMAARQCTDAASDRTVGLQRSAAGAQHDAETLRGTVSALEDERDKLCSLLAEEKHRVKGVESLIASAAARDAAASEQVRKLARENAELSTKLNEAKARLGGGGVVAGRCRQEHQPGGAWFPPPIDSSDRNCTPDRSGQIVVATTAATISFSSPSKSSPSNKIVKGREEERRDDEGKPMLIDYL